MCDDFTHLHVHTDASLIDGLGPVDRMVSGAKERGFNALAMTDHGTLANVITFNQACKYHGIKPITGLEAYVSRDGERFHLTLLANGNDGFNTLARLNNMGITGNDKYRPTFPLDALRRYNDGLIVLTGCPASPFQATEWQDALEIAKELKSALGNRLFAEVMFVSQSAPWQRAAKLAADVGLKPVTTNDVHFTYPTDADIHSRLVSMKTQGNLKYNSRKLWLATPNELEARVKRMAPEYLNLLQVGMRNAANISKIIKPVELSSDPKLPHIPDADNTLKTMAYEALEKLPDNKLHAKRKEYQERLKYELNIILKMDFATYFLILEDMITYAHNNGVWVGPGRGSGAGSLILYLLNITQIDPIQWGLSFDRFLNFKREEMPDVDVDIESEQREVVLDYADKKYDAHPVVTYHRYSHKSLTHDLAREFRINKATDVAIAEKGRDCAEFEVVANKQPLFERAYDAMLGQIRHVGKHAGGVIITSDEIQVPLERTGSGDYVGAWTEGEYRELSLVGIVKFDLLGLSAGSVLSRLRRKHNMTAPPPKDGDPVFDLFKEGDVSGIFQFDGSAGIRDFTIEVQPSSIKDLIAINALYRPGPLDSGAAYEYPRRAKNNNPRKLHPVIDDILAETYGVICYQEQFMAIFVKLTDGDMAEADLARKVLSKARPGQPEWESKMAKLKSQFFNGAINKGIDHATTQQIWDEIKTHTRYSFNKAHSAAYAHVAWSMAWWKYNFPADFYAALLSVDSKDWERYLFEIARRGIEIKPPHVNTSSNDFEAKNGVIYMPLRIIKYLGENGVNAILSARPFKSAKDFMARVPKKFVRSRARLGLLQLDAFSGMNDANYSTLEVKNPGVMSLQQKQNQYMGFQLPTKSLLDAIDKAEKDGLVAGVIYDTDNRESTYGKYTVYRLLPSGSYWSRQHNLDKGERVIFDIKSDTGKIVNVYPLTYN